MTAPTRPTTMVNEQRPKGGPVALRPHRPTMEKIGEVVTVHRDASLPLMAAAHQPVEIGSDRVMEKFDGAARPAPQHDGGAQKPRDQHAQASPEGYVRLQLHYNDGNLSVIGAKSVDGPLLNPAAVIEGYAYDVMIGERQISLGSIPDVGGRRAFANRDVTGREGKHRFFRVSEFDFFVRIPYANFTAEDLPRLKIVLQKVQNAPGRLTPGVAIARHAEVEAEEVARLSGVSLEATPEPVRAQLRDILNARGPRP
jgi:hypothetical protein